MTCDITDWKCQRHFTQPRLTVHYKCIWMYFYLDVRIYSNSLLCSDFFWGPTRVQTLWFSHQKSNTAWRSPAKHHGRHDGQQAVSIPHLKQQQVTAGSFPSWTYIWLLLFFTEMHLVKMIVTWPSDFHGGWGWKKHKRPPSRRQWENHGRPNLIRMDHMWNRDKISRWEGATLGPIPAVQRWHLDSQWQSTAENNNNRCLCCTFQKAVTKRFCSRFVHLETLDGKLGKNVTEQKGGGGWRHKTVRHANNNNNNNKGEESDQKTETDSASESSWSKKEAARRSCRTILVYTSVWFVPKTTFFSLKYVLRFWSLVQHTHTHTHGPE